MRTAFVVPFARKAAGKCLVTVDVSLTSVFERILEPDVRKRVNNHLEKQGLFRDNQDGFKGRF